MSHAPHRTKIPLPGGSGVVPSGAMQFENDWPGLFLRGDTAFTVSRAIRQLIEHQEKNPAGAMLHPLMVLENVADIIDNHVMIRPSEEKDKN